jgi:hypothetical protein
MKLYENILPIIGKKYLTDDNILLICKKKQNLDCNNCYFNSINRCTSKNNIRCVDWERQDNNCVIFIKK